MKNIITKNRNRISIITSVGFQDSFAHDFS